MDPNPEKYFSRINFGSEMRAIDKVIQKNQNTAKKKKKKKKKKKSEIGYTITKWRPK